MEWVAFGTLGFWLALAVVTVVAIAFLEFERNFFAFVSVLATFAFLHLVGAWDVIGFVKNNQWAFALYLAGYFAAGAVWSLMKWKLFVNRSIELYNESRSKFTEQRGLSADAEFTPQQKVDWLNQITGYHSHNAAFDIYETINFKHASTDASAAAMVDNCKGRILAWISYWPWSLLWTVVDDPLRKICRKIYQSLKGLYVGIAKALLEIVRKDLPTSIEEEAVRAEERRKQKEREQEEEKKAYRPMS